MIDSTIVERVGRRLAPDDKIKSGNKKFKEFMENDHFKLLFKKNCEDKLLSLKQEDTYYKKYKKPDIQQIGGQIEENLNPRQNSDEPESSVIQERISKLEFLFKKVSIAKGAGPDITLSTPKQV
ncbi:hypothetical protein NEHOM01_2358 [Nematocida homosporus]|uniref:uncharacterized protein n=1 Tax=Nematocida homosporus TaxID=1912981 RepID=UPI0022207DAC|nr:uncharacterized protein NEHOM01_2358 [Nematocida homosporus]KAI5187771.1 hypothetical protein NEHOM01_2358 [Nematocida homosporus]